MADFLQFDRVTKAFGPLRAVNEVSLSIREGEVFGLLGPSGCGKTTLLRLLAGFDQPDSGRILLGGRDITALPPERRPVNTVFQNYALFPHLSVWENVAFGLRVAGRAKTEIETEVARMLALVKLESHAAKKPAQLSGGQKQRVAIARALVNRPQVLVLDEPLAALDLKLRQHMLVELQKIHAGVGTTFVFVTHDQGEAMSLSDRIAVMNEGCVEQLGTPQDIYTSPANTFVAAFIGDTNFLHGTVLRNLTDGRAEIEVLGFPSIKSIPSHPTQPGQKVTLSLRPERIEISTRQEPAESGDLSVEGQIEDVIYLGADSRYGISVTGMKLWAVDSHDGSAHSPVLRKGQRVWVHFSGDDALALG